MKYLKKFSTDTDRIAYESSNDYIEPYVSLVSEDSSVHYNSWADDYFTTIAREDGTISFNIWKSMGTSFITSISYSTDNGETWTTTQNQNGKSEHLSINVNVNEGDKVLWKGSASQLGYYDEDDYGDAVGSFFSSDCEFDAQGNIMSLLYGDNFKGQTTIENEYAFAWLFSDYGEEKTCGVVNAKDLSLPATTLAESCYSGMFQDCTSLTTAPVLSATILAESCYQYMFYGCTSLATAPELPATVLAERCYREMFAGCTSLTAAPELPATTLAKGCYGGMFTRCTSLTTAPELPATTLAESCYSGMFTRCTSLTTAPELPATTLAEGCYGGMFAGCTSLTTAPELPATTLANNCYNSMFQNCTSLTTAPVLPATTLVNNCYNYMFQNCTNLNYIKAMFTTTPSSTYTNNWVNNVASSGTFIKNSAATWNVTGVHGVPTGWTVQTYNPYVEEYFTTVARENGTISFNIWKSMGTDMITSMSYSTDNGETWTTINNTDNKSEHLVINVNVNEGDKVTWKGCALQLGYEDVDYDDVVGSFFSSTCEFDVQGNVMSLLYGGDFKNKITIENNYAFAYLFSDYVEGKTCEVVNAKTLSLPATTLTNKCYYSMFQGCTSLTTTPVLPATMLAEHCYSYMFQGCTSLTLAPVLPATTLAYGCYYQMFNDCTNLTTAPELPATTLSTRCYDSMFYGCTSLTTAPVLSATTLAEGCYDSMFYRCKNLTTAPELPATTLAQYCYNCMFDGCTSLTTAPVLPATILVATCYSAMFNGCTSLNSITCLATEMVASSTSNWVKNVSASGTFTKNSTATWSTGNNGIPTGWTVQTASE